MKSTRRMILLLLAALLCFAVSCGNNGKSPPLYEVKDPYILIRHGKTGQLLGTYREKKPLMGISILDYTGTWYLDSTSDFAFGAGPWVCVVPVIDVPKRQRDYVIQLPENYTTTVDGLKFTVDFFQPYYEYNELIQVRICVENQTGEDMTQYQYDICDFYCTVFRDGEDEMPRFSFRKYHTANREGDPGWVPLFSEGDSKVLEYAFYADPTFFLPGENIQYEFSLNLNTNPYFPGGEQRVYQFSVPISVIKRGEQQEPEKSVNEKPEDQVSEKTLYPVPEYYYPQYAWCQGYSIYDYEGPWYLESTCDQLLAFSIYPQIELTEFQKDYVIKVPKEYSIEIEGITYALNFFQEYYEYNDLIQFKYTITNLSG